MRNTIETSAVYLIYFAILLVFIIKPGLMFGQNGLIINEFMAINNNYFEDDEGKSSDWIEIYNSGTSSESLQGWFLTDKSDNFLKWAFPPVMIAPDEYLIVFASGGNKTEEKDKLHTNFKLSGGGEFLALSNPDKNIYPSVFAPSFPEQFENISYAFINGDYEYTSFPTPGLMNIEGSISAPPKFSEPHGFYDTSMKIRLYNEQENSKIYYTTDASTPDQTNGILYTDSITIEKTAIIRAIAIMENTTPSACVTQSYIFPEDIFTQFEDQPGYPETWLLPHDDLSYEEIPSHYGANPQVLTMDDVKENIISSIKSLPIISIVTDKDNLFSKTVDEETGGIYIYSGESIGPTKSLLYHIGRGWERPASVEYFNSKKEDGNIDFQENIGLKIHGGASRSTRKTLKRSFKLGFKSKYGSPKLKAELFGPDAPDQYDRLILRGGFDRRLENQVVDPWVKSAMSEMGNYATKSKFVHLYLNGMYWGMYNLSEQIDDNCMRDNLGGEANDYDIIKDYYEVEAGDANEWDKLIQLAKIPENYQQLLGNTAEGLPDPSNEKLLNPENLINYIINISYNDPKDWDHHNWAAARRRTNSDGFHFIVWDAESGLSGGNKISWIVNGGNDNRPSGLFADLIKVEDFKCLAISRINKSLFEDGALTPELGLERYHFWLDQIDTAVIADQARWYADEGDIWNISHHEFIYDYFPNRTESVFKHFIGTGIYPLIFPPLFNTSNTKIPADFELMLSADPGDEIRYSTDGTDPGHYSIDNAPSIKIFDGNPIDLPGPGEEFTVKARVKRDSLWSILVQNTYTVEESSTAVSGENFSTDLLQCIPNPVTNEATIFMNLKESSDISLKVYNHMGMYISTLAQGFYSQGKHNIKWVSSLYPPGTYFGTLYNYNTGQRQNLKIIKH